MKHLKKYKIFESNDRIDKDTIDTIRYRLVDLEDDGFNVVVEDSNIRIGVLRIAVCREFYQREMFNIDDVKDILIELISELESDYELGCISVELYSQGGDIMDNLHTFDIDPSVESPLGEIKEILNGSFETRMVELRFSKL